MPQTSAMGSGILPFLRRVGSDTATIRRSGTDCFFHPAFPFDPSLLEMP